MSKTETKDTPPTSKTETPANPFANPFAGSFDPMAAFTASQQAFHQMMADGLQRMASFAEEYAALEAQMLARAQGAVASWAQLAQDAITYGAQLSINARRLGLETARKMGAGV
jgi:hypothetical protein